MPSCSLSQRYATTSETNFLLKRIAKKAGVPLQEFGIRNDMACGSTIGTCERAISSITPKQF